MNIKINGRTISIEQNILTYADIVQLSASRRTGVHSIVYDRMKKCDCSGSIRPNDSVLVSEGMSIDCCVTDNA